jgi:hypothetical protein
MVVVGVDRRATARRMDGQVIVAGLDRGAELVRSAAIATMRSFLDRQLAMPRRVVGPCEQRDDCDVIAASGMAQSLRRRPAIFGQRLIKCRRNG